MRLYRWRGAGPNFGDELNVLLWPRLLPDFFDDDPAERFLGIGSVLDARHPPNVVKLVAGAGYGGYQPLPVLDAGWVIHWVRGPRTAHRLGLLPACGLGDPAMLLPLAGWPAAGGEAPGAAGGPAPRGVGFMPHFESAAWGAWAPAAAAAGVELIDPSGDPETIMAAIGRCRLLLSEALHGAIVADALRVPWIALAPQAPIHRAKWHDWAETLDLPIEFHRLVASSLYEKLRTSWLAQFRPGSRLLESLRPALRQIARRQFTEMAAQALLSATTAPPQLSVAAALDRCQSRMLDRLAFLRHSPLRIA